ncbi:MAG TPA: hypothetical protein VMW42_11895 [Desulfatiglandales bacterium]|nr:hypothetical protein [Desulfatiglandales bacterium]
MRWIYVVIVLGCLLLTTSLFAADVDNDKVSMFRKLDDKINKELNNDKWNYASRAFVQVLWDNYKQAHENTKPELSEARIYGKSPDIQDYSQYVGAYTRDKEKTPNKVFLEIKKSDKGTFFVELAGYSFPAVATGKSIVFANGTIASSPTLPQFAAKPYCMLKIFTIARIDGKYFFFSLDAPPGEWLEIFKDVEK